VPTTGTMDFTSEGCSNVFGFIITGDNTSFENFSILEQRSTNGKATIYSVQQSKARNHTTSEANYSSLKSEKQGKIIVCFLLGNYPTSEFYMPTFRNTLFHLHMRIVMKNDWVPSQAKVLTGGRRLARSASRRPPVSHSRV